MIFVIIYSNNDLRRTIVKIELTEEVLKKLEFITSGNDLCEIDVVEQLIDSVYRGKLQAELNSIVYGQTETPVDDILRLLDLGAISREYVAYTMTIPAKVRREVLAKLDK